MAQTLVKSERLSSKTAISDLLKNGRWITAGCLKCCYLHHPEGSQDRILVSVPKRNFKRAVKRNLLKRRIRESYRTQKDLLRPAAGSVDVMFFYNIKDIADFGTVSTDLAQAMTLVRNKISGV